MPSAGATAQNRWRLKNAKLELPCAQPVFDDWDRAAPRAEATEGGWLDSAACVTLMGVDETKDEVCPSQVGTEVLETASCVSDDKVCPSQAGTEVLETASCVSDDSSDAGWSSKEHGLSGECTDRGAAFDGCWVGRGILAGSIFTFDDGPSLPVRYLNSDELELTVDGETHRGRLGQDGQLHWDDGDVWRRDVADAVSVRFGIRLHSHVRARHQCADVSVGEVGAVVGFTPERVEVKFARRIVRCSPLDVVMCDEDVVQQEGVGASSSCSGHDEAAGLLDGFWANRGESTRAVASVPSAPMDATRNEVVVQQEGVGASSSCSSHDEAAGLLDGFWANRGESNRAVASVPSAPMDATWYTGVVKWSRGSMAWLSCDELQARFPKQDIFLHRSDCCAESMPRQKDRIVFRLVVADGNPKACQARTEASHLAAIAAKMMPAKEYLSSRHQRLGR